MFAPWRADDLLSPVMRDGLAAAGVSRLQVNVRDSGVEGALHLEHLEHPIDALVST